MNIIKSLHLHNFKCFEDQTIAFAPLTMLAGLNGQGKSSVLQSLLLLRQSYQQGLLRPTTQTDEFSSRLALKGDLVQLGTGKDIYFEGGQDELIDIEVTWQSNDKLSLSFKYETDDDTLKLAQSQPFTMHLQTALFHHDFQYLQAERLGPRPFFEMSNFQVGEKRQLGTRGEYTTHFLSVYGNEKITNEIMAHRNAISLNLIHQVEAWLSEMSSRNTRLELTPLPGIDLISLNYSFVTEQQVSQPYRSVNVGFGFTYSLPILVAILSAKPGALLLLENPEAHLHPKGQAVLAELMVRAAKCGVQIVVETHSDHLINRLRRLVAEDLSNELAGLINILFVQQSDDQRSSYIEPLRLNEEGQIENWPPNFLIETAEDARAIVKAGIAKRRQMKGTNTP